MQQLDDRILEHLAEESWSTPRLMARTAGLRASEARITERCRLLADVELVAPIHRRTYEITYWGRLYLAGELDAATLGRPTP